MLGDDGFLYWKVHKTRATLRPDGSEKWKDDEGNIKYYKLPAAKIASILGSDEYTNWVRTFSASTASNRVSMEGGQNATLIKDARVSFSNGRGAPTVIKPAFDDEAFFTRSPLLKSLFAALTGTSSGNAFPISVGSFGGSSGGKVDMTSTNSILTRMVELLTQLVKSDRVGGSTVIQNFVDRFNSARLDTSSIHI
jgi:hypothetical protein